MREIIQLRPDYAEAHYELGKTLLQMGNIKEAVERLETAANSILTKLIFIISWAGLTLPPAGGQKVKVKLRSLDRLKRRRAAKQTAIEGDGPLRRSTERQRQEDREVEGQDGQR